MARPTLVIAALLAALGLAGYFAAAPEDRSWTALIPLFWGVALAILGALALNPKLRKHVMHLAAVLGLMGVVLPATRLPAALALAQGTAVDAAGAPRPASALTLISLGGMLLLCLVFSALCVKSFIDARRARQAAGEK